MPSAGDSVTVGEGVLRRACAVSSDCISNAARASGVAVVSDAGASDTGCGAGDAELCHWPAQQPPLRLVPVRAEVQAERQLAPLPSPQEAASGRLPAPTQGIAHCVSA